ncbi:hypothetical protein, partial [Segatella hominis]|uniref:hypothetical protein n=1 Tax=Segatella hominis TaxID=2518605 RepID=UPI003AB92C73
LSRFSINFAPKTAGKSLFKKRKPVRNQIKSDRKSPKRYYGRPIEKRRGIHEESNTRSTKSLRGG